jgi:hypothetical protein
MGCSTALRRIDGQVRKYARGDGKTIQFSPWRTLVTPGSIERSQSFLTNSVILMEGVSDERNSLTNKITYKRMAPLGCRAAERA